MEHTTSEAEFKIPTPPPLRNSDPDNYVPLRVFAFPLSKKYLVKWAKKDIISTETDDWILQQDAWREIKCRRPQKGWCRSTTVAYYDSTKTARAIVIATNRSTEEMAQAQDIDLIQQYRDLLNVDPGWYRRFT